MRGQELAYYLQELSGRLSNYIDKRLNGYTHIGEPEKAAKSILNSEISISRAGSHYSGVWIRDICFAAKGINLTEGNEMLTAVAESIINEIDDVFYTNLMGDYGVAAPDEGVDTFPSLVKILDEADLLGEYSEEVSRLAALYREKFFSEEKLVVNGRGSSWFDSASDPRETYNTAMLLAALSILEDENVWTTFSGMKEDIHKAFIDNYWNGAYFDENSQSSVKACDANVTPLYFGLVDQEKAESIIDELEELETEKGLKARGEPLSFREANPIWYLHKDYHASIWPWNSFMYTNAALNYGFAEKAEAEHRKIESLLDEHGNFLELFDLDGKPYIRNFYASAENFTAAAALWKEYIFNKNLRSR